MEFKGEKKKIKTQEGNEGQGNLCHIERGDTLSLSPKRILIPPLINPHVTLGKM